MDEAVAIAAPRIPNFGIKIRFKVTARITKNIVAFKLVKFCDAGNKSVPHTSHKIAIKRHT